MDKRYISYIGSLIVIIGMACPVLKTEDGSVTLLTYSKTTLLGVVLIILALLCIFYVWKRIYPAARRMAIGIAVGVLVTLVDNYLGLSKMEGDITDVMAVIKATGISWGWIVLLIGAGLAVYATTWLKGEQDDEDMDTDNGDMLPYGRF